MEGEAGMSTPPEDPPMPRTGPDEPGGGHDVDASVLPEATWRWWEAVLVAFMALVAGVIAGVGAALTTSDEELRFLLTIVALHLSLATTVVVWLRVMHRPAIPALGLPERPWSEAGAGVVAGLTLRVSLFLVVPLVSYVIEWVTDNTPAPPEQLPDELAGAEIAVAVIGVVVLAPIAEELFYRGFLFLGLRARRGFGLAASVSALAFGLSHFSTADSGSVLLVSVMTFVGFGLAWLYERRRRILVPILAHATFNAIGFVLILLI